LAFLEKKPGKKWGKNFGMAFLEKKPGKKMGLKVRSHSSNF
jgi:hypothetical protein